MTPETRHISLGERPPFICPDCDGTLEYVSAGVVYPYRHDWKHRMFWRCEPCKAWVPADDATGLPVGTVANAVLRALREEVWGKLAALISRKLRLVDRTYEEVARDAAGWLGRSIGLNGAVRKHHLTLEQCRAADRCLAQFIHRGVNRG